MKKIVAPCTVLTKTDDILANPDYVIGLHRPDKVRGEACLVFTGSAAIARKSGILEILA